MPMNRLINFSGQLILIGTDCVEIISHRLREIYLIISTPPLTQQLLDKGRTTQNSHSVDAMPPILRL
jgi:hypothetical protein